MMNELHLAVGQILIGGFPGEEVHQDFAELARDGCVGGAILFRRNLVSLEQAAHFARSLLSLPAPERLFLPIDQEGGRVQRLLAPFPELPPMRAFGDARRKTFAMRAGRLIGDCLRLVGFQQNYAPVLDVDSNPQNPVIGDRSFSRDPSAVARLGAAYIEGLQSAGVAACGKHFPGHGDTSEDSHLALPKLPHDRARLEQIELVPFRAAVRSGVAAIMTAHIVFPALDPQHPATLSEHVIRRLLREELGYEGVIVSDDLEMKAIADHYGIGDAAVRAVRAGCDQLLVCHHPALLLEAHHALVDAVERGMLPRERVLEAAARVRRMKVEYRGLEPLPPPAHVESLLPREDHHRLLAALAGEEIRDIQAGGPAGTSAGIVEYALDDTGPDLDLDVDPTEPGRKDH